MCSGPKGEGTLVLDIIFDMEGVNMGHPGQIIPKQWLIIMKGEDPDEVMHVSCM